MAEVGLLAMLESVLNYLSGFVRTEKDEERVDVILRAMEKVDRKFFVTDPNYAYMDDALPLAHSQTISQPSTVGRMLLLAALEKHHDVLEVGAGSGWNAGLISYIVHPGVLKSIERVPQLAEIAGLNMENFRKNTDFGTRRRIKHIHFENINFFSLARYAEEDDIDEDGRFDRIIITAGIVEDDKERIIDAAEALLKEDGVLVCPFAAGPIMRLVWSNGEITEEYTREEYYFVPLQ